MSKSLGVVLVLFAIFCKIAGENYCEICVKEGKIFLVLPNYSLACAKDELEFPIVKTTHKDLDSCQLAAGLVEFGGL